MARIIGNGGSTAQSASGLRGIPPSAIDRADPGHLGNVGLSLWRPQLLNDHGLF